MQFMSRSYNLNLADCAQKMNNQAAEALERYFFSDIPPCFDSTGFTEILLLDSFFILLMLTSNETFSQVGEALHECALEFFETIHPTPNRHSKGQDMPLQFLHLLDLFHWSRVPKDKYRAVHKPPHKQLKYSIDLPRHTRLRWNSENRQQCLQRRTSGSSLDITVRSGSSYLLSGAQIPRLHIHDYSSRIFHNLIAFEMQCPSRGCCTMAFSAFLRSLLQSEEDVKLLRRRGILGNKSVTNGELVDFFKRLSKLTENQQMPIDLYNVYRRVLSHHNRRMSRFCGSIVLRYFPNPLVTLSVFAAIMLFVLNFLQTIYTVLSYYHS
uniref:Uncharacterized protein n=1 Tax=Ananas comosus var. bracteatus TaxID=296719 RepID=A0A6V7P114_ANACO|nr:unnamed protein product [Ananas comosus var. bracteatus]